MAKKDVYVTRDLFDTFVEIWPATIGIRKFHGPEVWGAAWNAKHPTCELSKTSTRFQAKYIDKNECQKRFGFYPQPSTAWLIEYTTKGRMKQTKIDIDFSN